MITADAIRRAAPNLVTLARAAAGPAGAWLLLSSRAAGTEAGAVALGAAAGGVFLLAALSDALDGWLARRFDAGSPLGAFLDPVADKILVASYLLAFAAIAGWDLWLAAPVAAIILRDLAVTGLRIARPDARAALAVTETAKMKTAAEMIVIALPFILVAVGMTAVERWFYLWVGGVWFAALLSLWTGALYAAAAFRRS